MTRDTLINMAINNLKSPPDDKLAEIADFTE